MVIDPLAICIGAICIIAFGFLLLARSDCDEETYKELED